MISSAADADVGLDDRQAELLVQMVGERGRGPDEVLEPGLLVLLLLDEAALLGRPEDHLGDVEREVGHDLDRLGRGHLGRGLGPRALGHRLPLTSPSGPGASSGGASSRSGFSSSSFCRSS